MFKKLIKYDLKSVGAPYLLLNLSFLVVALLLGFAIKNISDTATVTTTYEASYAYGQNMASNLINFALTISFAVLLTGMAIYTLLIIISRFKRNVFGREAYLTLTLPVSYHQIILSKLTVAILLTILNVFLIIVAVGLLMIPSVGFTQFLDKLPLLKPYFFEGDTYLLLLWSFLSSISSILLIYFAIAIGQLFHERRRLMAFVAFFSLVVIEAIFGEFLNSSLGFTSWIIPEVIYTGTNSNFWFPILQSLTSVVIYYFGTHYILKNKLNLE